MGRKPKTVAGGDKKLDVISKLVSSIQKKHGKESINFLGNKEVESIPRFSSGSSVIDEITGGGYPIGRIIEFFGAESSGKSTACYHAIAEAQKAFPDKVCAFIDSEFAFDPEYAQKIGVNVGELLVSQPDSGEDAFNLCHSLLENDDVKISLIVVDSVAAMLPRSEAEEEDYGKNTVGLQARMMSKALRKLTSVLGRSGAVIIFTNQTRSMINVRWGSPETTSGGNALKFYDSIRLKFTSIGRNMEGTGDDEEAVSVRVRVEAVKNKTAPPFRKGEFIITFLKGIDEEASVLEIAIARGIIVKKGSWFSIDGSNVAQGMVKLRAYLEDNPAVFEDIKDRIRSSQADMQSVVEGVDSNSNDVSSDDAAIDDDDDVVSEVGLL